MDSWHRLLYPALACFLPEEQGKALAAARDTKYDLVEMLGIALALAITLSLIEPLSQWFGVGGRLPPGIASIIVAVPVLAGLIAPFMVRRTRRGLRAELTAREKKKRA